jgi:4-hydroxybenzoate polyprenyltransferase
MDSPKKLVNQTLFVDLDDTLIKGDLLKDQALQLAFSKPWLVPLLLIKALKGPLSLKTFLVVKTQMRPESLLYRESVLELINSHREAGNKVYLASASPAIWVEKVAIHLQCFDGHAGSAEKNLKGAEKLRHIRSIAPDRFAYAGDAISDHAIWEQCHTAVSVNPKNKSRMFLGHAKKTGMIKEWFNIQDRKPLLKSLIKAIRPHQWAKNVLLALPFVAAHQILTPESVSQLFRAFVSFSMIASSVYLLNDLSDRPSDRAHPTKRNRPLASGDVPLELAIILQLGLLFASLGLALTISTGFLFCLSIYFAANLAYTFSLKRVPMLDVVLLSGMYTLRMIAGGQATSTLVSQWLLVFSTFFFMGLALVKRYTEVSTLVQKVGPTNEFGRGYAASDAPILLGLGMGCSLLAVLVVALYLNSSQVMAIYVHPDRLWSLVPILIYWSGRIWLLAGRRKVQDDPVSFALKDPTSWVVGGVALAILKYAI